MPKPTQKKATGDRMMLTGDVRQRVFLGLPSEESRPISNAEQGNQYDLIIQ
jgi:hypothetical protein